MILMEETEIMKDHCKVPLEMLRIRKKNILDELSACNATWMQLNHKLGCFAVFLARPLRKSLIFFNMLAMLALLSDYVWPIQR